LTHLDLEAIDRDGAVRDALADAEGLTRSDAFRAALVGFGGATLLGGLAAGTASAASRSKANDIKILNFALVLERLGATFYDEAIDKKVLKGETLTFARTTLRDERAHVVAVQKQIRALGGKVGKSPRFDFGDTTDNASVFRRTSERMEQLCVEALNGAGPLVTKPTLAAAGALVSVEARQVAWVRLLRGVDNPVTEGAFDRAATLAQVRSTVAATGFVKPTPKTPRLSS
jgi:hypothetical protein